MAENKHSSVPLANIAIKDQYWDRYIDLVPNVVLPYQWDILNGKVPDAPPSYCLQNFRIAAGEAEGERKGVVFQDSDVAKWLEAVAYTLEIRPDEALERTADEVIALICRAQCEDGYLNTYYTLVEPERRWQNLTEGHELYCAGHMIEAAVAYYNATGKRALLDVVCRFADLIGEVFGPKEGQNHGYPGHPEIELALVRLYHATGEKRYADLAKYFVDVRGGTPNYFSEETSREDYKSFFAEFFPYDTKYSQSHLPVRQQDTAEGHAVRAVYLYAAMADLADIYDDAQLLHQCEVLWRNMVDKRMYITGGIGSSGLLERFTTDYDLPNDCNYAETCASIGLAMFGLRMARLTKDASYIDVVERALYNTMRAGISMEGNRYFYVNPLEVWPDACMERTSRDHVKAVRQKWFDVPCCPTNVARTLTSLGGYMYSVIDDELYLNLYLQNEATVELGGKTMQLAVGTNYPKTGSVSIRLNAEDADFTLCLRVPAFAKDFTVQVNGEAVAPHIEKGYCRLQGVGGKDSIFVSFAIEPQFVYSNPLVRANEGKVAIQRGPEVYCLEEVDNGPVLAAIAFDTTESIREEWREDILGGTMLLHCSGSRALPFESGQSFGDAPAAREAAEFTLVPYGSWGNRETGEMLVWVSRDC